MRIDPAPAPDIGDGIEFPVVPDPACFDASSGSWPERLVFNHRAAVLLLCALATLLLGWQAKRLTVNADFEAMLPREHPYVRDMAPHAAQLRGLRNVLRVVIERSDGGDLHDAAFLATVREATDRLYLMPGVDRATMRGLWLPSLRWTEVTEDGYRGGPVMPERFDGSQAALRELRLNLARAGALGRFVGDDQRSTLILVPLLPRLAETGLPIDVGAFSRELDARVRSLERPGVVVRIVGFTQLAGDLIAGLSTVALCFAVSVALAGGLIGAATRCARCTLLLVGCALLAVLWLLGLMRWLGYRLDPYTVLVPFLVFAIGLSHGAQKLNGVLQEIGRGTHRLVAARHTFRRLFVPGLTALLANVVGFGVLGLIDIPVIRDMAITASLGVALLIVTKLVLVPVVLSYVGAGRRAAARSLRPPSRAGAAVTRWLTRLTEPRRAAILLLLAGALGAAAWVARGELRIGDLGPGAPELRPEARYNRDAAYLAAHYGLASDPFVVLLATPPGGCLAYETLVEVDRLAARLRELPGVRGTASAAEAARGVMAGQFEGNPKWWALSRNPSLRGAAIDQARFDDPALVDPACSALPIVAFLADHQADTLARVAGAAEAFAREHDAPGRRFILAAGSAGLAAATNSVVEQGVARLHAVLYAAVALLCWLTFRDGRAVLVALLPLVFTSLLCEALMALLGIGLQVATLPVIAVGVGVGVDYAIYLLSIQLAAQRRGAPLAEACGRALGFNGRVVALVALTLAAGVFTWVVSPIRFQAEMGLLLGFMLLWNMAGALLLIPALSAWWMRRVRPA